MGLYKVTDNSDTVFASDIDQFSDALSGANDIGTVKLFAPISPPGAPTVAVNTTAGNLTGAYSYVVVFVTGYWKGQVGSGTLETQGNTGYGTASASVSPSAQQVNVTGIPIGPTGTVARIIGRTKAGGSTYFTVTQINDNTTTSFTDNVADTSLGAQLSTTNTTGTNLQLPNLSVIPATVGPAGSVIVVNGDIYVSSGTAWQIVANQAGLANGYDLNTLSTTGFYQLTNPTNGPVTNASAQWDIYHIQHSGTSASQIAIQLTASAPPTSGVVYTRVKFGGSWDTWQQFATRDWVDSVLMLPKDQYNATTTPDGGYPQGTSVMEVTTATGWNFQYGTVATFYNNINRCFQIAMEKTTGKTWIRTGDSAETNSWSNWAQIYNSTDFKNSIVGGGYQYLPSGMILQWGIYANTGGTNGTTIPFNIAFPSALYSITATPLDSAMGTTSQSAWITGSNTSNFYVRSNNSEKISWMAIGK